MGDSDYLDLGDYNAACYECGRKRKASQLKRYWKGYYVCAEHWEPRQPQDFVRGIPDIQTPPWVQDQTDTYIQVCTPYTSSAIPGYAQPGCMIPGGPLPGKTDLMAFVCTPVSVLPQADFGTADCMTLGEGGDGGGWY